MGVTLPLPSIGDIARSSLTGDEQRRAVVYLDTALASPGEHIEIDGEARQVHQPTFVVFVDGEPEANWGHRCRYLLIGATTGEIESIEAHLPPFLRGVPDTLRLVWRAAGVPDWALATNTTL